MRIAFLRRRLALFRLGTREIHPLHIFLAATFLFTIFFVLSQVYYLPNISIHSAGQLFRPLINSTKDAIYSAFPPGPLHNPLRAHHDAGNGVVDIREKAFQDYGLTGRPDFLGASNLPSRDQIVVPLDTDRIVLPSQSHSDRRLIFIGDVRGAFESLQSLLAHLNYREARDHLVFTGNIVGTSAANTISLLDYLIERNASVVRGQREDRLLLVHDALERHRQAQKKKGGTKKATTAAEQDELPKPSEPGEGTERGMHDRRTNSHRTRDDNSENFPDGSNPDYSIRLGSSSSLYEAVSFLSNEELAEYVPEDMRSLMLPPALGSSTERSSAELLTDRHLAYLRSFPSILRAGRLAGLDTQQAPAGELVVTHGGLIPGLSLDDQDPSAVLFTRSLEFVEKVNATNVLHKRALPLAPAQSRAAEGEQPSRHWRRGGASPLSDFVLPVPVAHDTAFPWSQSWDQHQRRHVREHQVTVVYGHDATRGFVQGSHTFGLDTGCHVDNGPGGKLTALVFSGHAEKGITRRIESVDCS